MKKRLLITSIVMMLVVAVALSTATYAWFTSNASVTANSISLEAATSSADAIGIGWTTATISTAITPVDFEEEGGLLPAVPSTVTADTSYASIDFKGGTIKSENGADVYNDDVDDVEPYVWSDDASHESFFIKNLSTANALNNLHVSAYVDGEGAELVRIAIFQKASSTYDLVGILGYSYTYTALTNDAEFSDQINYYKQGTHYNATNDTNVRGFVKDATITSSNFAENKENLYTRTASATNVFYGTVTSGGARVSDSAATVTSINLLDGANVSIAPLGTIELKVVVWLDGDKLDDQTQGRTANIKLNFAASSAPAIA